MGADCGAAPSSLDHVGPVAAGGPPVPRVGALPPCGGIGPGVGGRAPLIGGGVLAIAVAPTGGTDPIAVGATAGMPVLATVAPGAGVGDGAVALIAVALAGCHGAPAAFS